MTDERTFGPLSSEECRRRLEGGSIGRVAWNTVDGPQVLPVTYAVHNDAVVFRTAAYGPLADLRHVRRVAFEIDEFDAESRTGWSVVVVGQSRAAAKAAELVELWSQADPVPWAPGTRNLFIEIRIDQLSGRSIGS
jgi:nitroimidazol reductase NimA-like FMN-containing flavoprotein (pyridoxamine 5'-phosphate oxidase superfamily)